MEETQRLTFTRLSKFILFMSSAMAIAACGGGGSSTGMVVEGTLIEAGAGHDRAAYISKHGAGEPLENIEICAPGICAKTDSEGNWGFSLPETFTGGTLALSIVGHGIDTQTSVEIPEGASVVALELNHVDSGAVEVEHKTIDGVTAHLESEGHGAES